MRKILVTLLFVFSAIITFSQSPEGYKADLEYLHSVLKKTPSYKEQIKGDELKKYRKLYDSLEADGINILTPFEYFCSMAQLFFPIRDNHLGFYQVPDYQRFKDSSALEKYIKSAEFKSYPKSAINTDSLQLALSKKPKDSIEGIYYYGPYFTVGLFRSTGNQYLGVVVDTKVSVWEKGQIAIRLYENSPGNFNAIYGHPLTKQFILYQNEKFRNQSLINSRFYASFSETSYKKNPNEKDYVNIPKSEPQFQYRRIRPDIQYIHLGNFSAMNTAMKISDAFYEQIKDSLTAAHLIVDLRNNTGGAYKVSKKFLQLIKKYAKKGKVCLLINNETISQGEIFILQLKDVSSLTVYGQTTMGKIAYGSNYGNREQLPHSKLEVYITDMKDKGNHLPYENIGVTPDIFLRNDADWIEQVLKLEAGGRK